MSYSLIGKLAQIALYNKDGTVVGIIQGKISDFSPNVDVSLNKDGNIKKDLIYLTEITGYQSPHVKEKEEGWFAVQDIIKSDLQSGLSLNRN